MLHERGGAIGVAFLLAAAGVEADEVAGDVLYLLLGAFFHLLPRSCAQAAQAGRFALLAFVFADFVERVDADEHHVVVAIDEFDDFLRRAVGVGHPDESGKTAYAVVHVHHEVARLELRQFFQRQRHLSVAGTVAAQAVLVETVEYLVVGVEAGVERVVDVTGVERVVDGREAEAAAHLVEDALQALVLFGTVGTDIEGIAGGQVLAEGLTDKVEVLVEKRLGGGVETHGGLRLGRGVRADFDALQGEHAAHEGLAGDEERLAVEAFGLFGGLHLARGVALSLRLASETVVVDARNEVVDEAEVVEHGDGVRGEQVGEGDQRVGRGLEFGHDGHGRTDVARQLRLDVERAQRLYLVAEEVGPEREFRRVGVDVENAAADGKLTGLVDVVPAAEPERQQAFLESGEVGGVADGEADGPVVERAARGYPLGHGVGIGHHHPRLPVGRTAQAAQHVGAQYFVGCIALGVFHRPPIGRREKEHLLLTEHLDGIVVKVTGGFGVVHHGQQQAAAHPAGQGRHHHRGRRAAKPRAENRPYGTVAYEAGQGFHAGMPVVKRSYVFRFHRRKITKKRLYRVPAGRENGLSATGNQAETAENPPTGFQAWAAERRFGRTALASTLRALPMNNLPPEKTSRRPEQVRTPRRFR